MGSKRKRVIARQRLCEGEEAATASSRILVLGISQKVIRDTS
jgi:hypothetical protein